MNCKVDDRQLAENRSIFLGRQELYKKRGLDHLGHRDLLLQKAGRLKGRVLEIGSGRGYMALALARAGCRFVSIDLDMEMLSTTILNLGYEHLLGNVELCISDIYRLCFEDKSFHSVIAVDFFHHVEDIRQAAAEIDRVLAPGGRVVISDFNAKGRSIVSAIHEEEGRKHIDFTLSLEDIERPFRERGYQFTGGEDECHWFFMAGKPEGK